MTMMILQQRRGKREKEDFSSSCDNNHHKWRKIPQILNHNCNEDAAATTTGSNGITITSRRKKRQLHNNTDVSQPQQAPMSPSSSPSSISRGGHRNSKNSKKNTNTSGGSMVVLLPSFIGVTILICSVMAKYGFRGRPTTCGIDLGTTNSVICIQEQQPQQQVQIVTTGSKSGILSSLLSFVLSSETNHQSIDDIDSTVANESQHLPHVRIRCIADPNTGSPVVPSVVSFLDAMTIEHHRQQRQVPTSKSTSILSVLFNYVNNYYDYYFNQRVVMSNSNQPIHPLLNPDPSHVIVGQAAKRRIDSHPHHTLYHAKRVLGRPTYDPAIATLRMEVEFQVNNRSSSTMTTNGSDDDDNDNDNGVEFRVPDTPIPITPDMVGSYIVHYLLQMTSTVLGHTNIKSAVICVPAKFNAHQRAATVLAFRNAGINVARIVEEPTAAALAYGLHRKPGVDYIVVYDFGGGTLDVSLLHVSDGYVDVLGSDGDDRLGGSDFDDVICKFILQRTNGTTIVQTIHTILEQIQESSQQHSEVVVDLEEALSQQCPALHETPMCTISSYHTLSEQLKIGLSEQYRPDKMDEEISVSAHCLGIKVPVVSIETPPWTIERFCSALEVVTLTLTSTEFNHISQPLFDRSILPVERLLRDLNIQSTTDIQEIVMVGGTTRMPQIRALVQRTFPNSQLNIRIDPDLTVAYGAASVID